VWAHDAQRMQRYQLCRLHERDGVVGFGWGVSAYEKIPVYQSAYDGPVYSESPGGISKLTDGMRATPTSRSTRIDYWCLVYDSTRT